MRSPAPVRAAVPILWAAAMLAARFLDPWIPIAIGAFGLSVLVLAVDRPLMLLLFRPAVKAVALGAIAAVAMIAVTYLFFPLAARTLPLLGGKTAEIYAAFLSGRPLLSVVLFVVPVVCAEEVLWRGAFQEWVAVHLPHHPLAVVVLSAGVYALSHLFLGSWLLVTVAFVCGLYWSALRLLSRSLWPSLLAHLAWDLALILVPLHR
jgi:membrane protease YdiL (CAAX protease family)